MGHGAPRAGAGLHHMPTSRPYPDARLSWRVALVVFASFLAVTIALTWPLATHLSSTLPHDLGDPLFSTTVLWWNSHVTPLTSRWWTGFFFQPATGTLAFSDHRLGESLIASPLLWLGASPVAAYNLTLLLTFPLSGLAAYWLGFALTRRHDAAIVCGMAYGFAPYRLAHIEHLELLAAYGMPAALAALHRLRDTRRFGWLIAFASALVVQWLCSGYYLLFFAPFLALWALWFLDWRDWRLAIGVVAAGTIAALALAPIGLAYLRIHRFYGLQRDYGQILELSADVTSLVTASPMLALWGWTSRLNGPERQIFPGLTIVVLAGAGAVSAWWHGRRARASRPFDRFWLVPLAVALIELSVAAVTHVVGPWRFGLGPLVVSADVVSKPVSVALVALLVAAAVSPSGRAAWRARSPLAFYVAATVFLFLCSFGPRPTFLGRRVLYQPPYAWFMHLSIFAHGVRVPARFAMPAMLALAAAGGLAYARLTVRPRYALVAVVAAAVLADTWTSGIPLPQVPAVWPAHYASMGTAVVELPLGEVFEDTAAMYRAAVHDRPTVNGYSGYEPAHYVALRLALAAGDSTPLDAVGEGRPLLVAVDLGADTDGRWRALIDARPDAVHVGREAGWAFYEVPTASGARPTCRAPSLAVRGAVDRSGPVPIARLTDGNPDTYWSTEGPQKAGDALTLDLGRVGTLCGVELSLGRAAVLFPRFFTVETSADGGSWEVAWSGAGGGPTTRSALAHPIDVRLTIDFTPRPARFVRVRLDRSDPIYSWLVTDVGVRGVPRP